MANQWQRVGRIADEQAQRNRTSYGDARAANAVNQTSPWGGVTWSPDGMSVQTTLNPADQGILDGQRSVKQRLLAAILAGLGGMGGGAGRGGYFGTPGIVPGPGPWNRQPDPWGLRGAMK